MVSVLLGQTIVPAICKGGEVGLSLEFVNRICPNCKNPNYVVSLGDFSKAYKYKCMNCNRYFNDIDFEESLQPVWKSECMNTKADMVEVVRCKDCKYGEQLFPDYISCQISDENESGCHASHKPEWFCADGERKDDDA